METKPDKPGEQPTDAHDHPPQDQATKDKISKHLSDIDDTISEEDIKNINTDTGSATPATDTAHDKDEADEEKTDDDEEPEEEAPSSWEILGD